MGFADANVFRIYQDAESFGVQLGSLLVQLVFMQVAAME